MSESTPPSTGVAVGKAEIRRCDPPSKHQRKRMGSGCICPWSV
jgi:hypothetical protein